MDSQHERLRRAREAAGFETATDAAEAMGVKVPTYIHHENGRAGLSRVGQKYARFFKVSYEWLMTGRGDMKPARAPEPTQAVTIGIDGLVGAGARVEQVGETAASDPPDWAEIPTGEEVGALIVRGESQWPRFLDGEVIIYDRRPVLPAAMVGRYAIVQTFDGRRLLKILKRGSKEAHFTLASHNAPDEEDVRLLGAWRYLGVLAVDGGRAR